MEAQYISYNYPDETERIKHTVGYINEQIENGHGEQLVAAGEAWHDEQLKRIAQDICAHEKVRVVLLAGPSSSGKTSSSYKLCLHLLECGKKPVALSLDNWFVEPEKTPLDEKGKPDYESVYALDLALLWEDLKGLIAGEKMRLPVFNFLTARREYKGKRLQLHPDNILVIEGIHALNPELTAKIPEEIKFRVYASALTTILLDHHNYIPTTDNRLLRRIIRDHKYRGVSAQESIRRWPSVRAGEQKWIFPYQENADEMFNTAMIYELAVIRQQAEPLLEAVPENADEFAEAYRLSKFLKYFSPIPYEKLPATSLLREFLGGSSFTY